MAVIWMLVPAISALKRHWNERGRKEKTRKGKDQHCSQVWTWLHGYEISVSNCFSDELVLVLAKPLIFDLLANSRFVNGGEINVNHSLVPRLN
jgi:hypothetical protein